MFKVTCYKAVLSPEQFYRLSNAEIKDVCQFEYSIETTPEIYFAIKPHELCFLPDEVCETGDKVIVAFYITKTIEVYHE